MYIFKTVALVAAALFVATSAHANMSTSASLTHLQYVLYDLDLNDGIDASISFEQGGVSNHTRISAFDGSFLYDDVGVLSSTLSTPLSLAEASSKLSVFPGSAFVASSYTTATSGEDVYSRSNQLISFVLGAGSGVRWTADIQSESFNTESFNPNRTQYTEAFLEFHESSSNASDYRYRGGLFGMHCINFTNNHLCAESQPFSFEIRNESSMNVLFNGQVNVVASIFTPPIPIPEPETYALMLAGLGVMGAVARRRKAKQV